MSEKFCPLVKYEDGRVVKTAKCIDEKCAWWDSEEKKCAILVIAENLKPLGMKGNDFQQ